MQVPNHSAPPTDSIRAYWGPIPAQHPSATGNGSAITSPARSQQWMTIENQLFVEHDGDASSMQAASPSSSPERPQL